MDVCMFYIMGMMYIHTWLLLVTWGVFVFYITWRLFVSIHLIIVAYIPYRIPANFKSITCHDQRSFPLLAFVKYVDRLP